jgi:hypothetical protein
MAVCASLIPGLIIGYCLRLFFADGLQSLDSDIEIPHNAKMGVKPFEFTP